MSGAGAYCKGTGLAPAGEITYIGSSRWGRCRNCGQTRPLYTYRDQLMAHVIVAGLAKTEQVR